MLSILIPVYNSDPGNLLKDLQVMGKKTGFPFEIIVCNDGSDEIFRSRLDAYTSLSDVKLMHLSENKGRASSRNCLAREAKYPFLVFIDADAKVMNSDYLMNYLSFCRKGKIAVCGGVTYNGIPPAESDKKLRWLYGRKREMKNAYQRSKSPSKSFSAFNLFVSAEVFRNVKFNEEMTDYGHEDTFFGIELEKNGVDILHIENPLLHLGIDNAEVFLEKSRAGVRNLLKLRRTDQIQNFSTFRLLGVFSLISRLKLIWLFRKLFEIFRRRIEGNLFGRKPRLFYFDLYKLLYLTSIS